MIWVIAALIVTGTLQLCINAALLTRIANLEGAAGKTEEKLAWLERYADGLNLLIGDLQKKSTNESEAR